MHTLAEMPGPISDALTKTQVHMAAHLHRLTEDQSVVSAVKCEFIWRTFQS